MSGLLAFKIFSNSKHFNSYQFGFLKLFVMGNCDNTTHIEVNFMYCHILNLRWFTYFGLCHYNMIFMITVVIFFIINIFLKSKLYLFWNLQEFLVFISCGSHISSAVFTILNRIYGRFTTLMLWYSFTSNISRTRRGGSVALSVYCILIQ